MEKPGHVLRGGNRPNSLQKVIKTPIGEKGKWGGG